MRQAFLILLCVFTASAQRHRVEASSAVTWWETSADFVPLVWRADTVYNATNNACIGSNDTIYKSIVSDFFNYDFDPTVWRTSDVDFWLGGDPPDYQGEWDSGIDYVSGQKVMYSDKLWTAIQNSTGSTPTEGAAWTLLGDTYDPYNDYSVDQWVWDGENGAPAKCLVAHGLTHGRGIHSPGESPAPVWQVYTTFQIWRSDVTYALNAKVLNTQKTQVYKSLQNSNTNHNPQP